MAKNDEINALIGILIIILLFVLTSYYVNSNIEYIQKAIGFSYMGMIIYVLISILSIVVAPISAIPLLPLATGLYGWFLAGTLSVIGWTIGAIISFQISRKYGVDLVKKIIPLKKITNFEKFIPEEHLFLTVVFLSMVVPVDGLSYFMGLFSKMSLKSFTFATIIGIIPFSFILAYSGTLPLEYQLIFSSIGLSVILIGLLIAQHKKNIKNKKE